MQPGRGCPRGHSGGGEILQGSLGARAWEPPGLLGAGATLRRARRVAGVGEPVGGRVGLQRRPGEIADLQYRRGEILAAHLGHPEGAVDIFSEALGLVPGHAKTVEALQGLLENSELRQRVAGILEPLYTEAHEWQKLVDILEVHLEARRDDPVGAVDLLARIAEIQTEQMRDVEAAFATWRRALKLQPGDGRVRDALEGIIENAGRWGRGRRSLSGGASRPPMTRIWP